MQDFRHTPPGVARRTAGNIKTAVSVIRIVDMTSAVLEMPVAQEITAAQVRAATSWGELNARMLP